MSSSFYIKSTKILSILGSMHICMEVLFQYLDLLCISIAADIVPITGENRILAHFGLGHLNEFKRAGIFQLLRTGSKENQDLTIEDIVFTIAPRIKLAAPAAYMTKELLHRFLL